MPISLSEITRSLNRMNNGEVTHKEEQLEKETEERLVEEVEKSWEEAKAEEQTKEEFAPITLEQVYLELQALTDAVSNQADELKKINKHINATQKMLKKAQK